MIPLLNKVTEMLACSSCLYYLHIGERGLGLVVHIPSGCVAKINIP
jgi:hypothetical protein